MLCYYWYPHITWVYSLSISSPQTIAGANRPSLSTPPHPAGADPTRTELLTPTPPPQQPFSEQTSPTTTILKLEPNRSLSTGPKPNPLKKTMEEEPSHQSRTPSPSLKPERESVGFASPIPSSSPLPLSVARLWRPSAQRNLRNQWSKLASLRQQWSSSSSAGRSHATSLVNAYLSQKYIPSMELGVLSDMPAIRNKASLKLFKQQEVHQSNLLSSYKDMVSIVTQMVKTSKSMRCYLKGASSSSLIRFSDSPEDQSDLGDGGGIPVFTFLSISSFEKFADELVQMLILELNLKRLLVVELLSVSCEPSKLNQFSWSDELYSGEFDGLSVCNLYSEENSEPIFPQTGVSKSDVPIAQYNPQPNQETLQVYLTTWLAEVNVDTYRVDEIFSVIGEEMHVKIS